MIIVIHQVCYAKQIVLTLSNISSLMQHCPVVKLHNTVRQRKEIQSQESNLPYFSTSQIRRNESVINVISVEKSRGKTSRKKAKKVENNKS